MTYLDKYMQEHPGANVISDVYDIGCPYHYNYEKNYDCSGVICSECWNREMPEEKETYSHEEVKKMCGITDEDLAKIPDEAIEFEDEDLIVPFVDIKGKPIITSLINSIKDSGDRTRFATGAVRDMHEGKGRCDLLPLDVVAMVYDYIEENIMPNWLFIHFYNFQQDGDINHLLKALECFNGFDGSIDTMFLEVAKHFEDGAKKYGEYNWQKGIPVNCYIDSAVRHYLKYLRGDEDERHDRAFVWNILCCIWTCKNKPELNTYLKEKENEKAGTRKDD